MKKFKYILIASAAILSGAADAAVRYTFSGQGGGSIYDSGSAVSGSFSFIAPVFPNFGVSPTIFAGPVTSISQPYQTDDCTVSVGTNCSVVLLTSTFFSPTGTAIILRSASPTADPNFFTLNQSIFNFAAGSFSNYGTYSAIGPNAGTLTVSEVSDQAPAVPEPASWAMMIGGFGLIGAALRRNRTLRVAFG